MEVIDKFYTSAKLQGERPLYPPNTRIQGPLNRCELLEKRILPVPGNRQRLAQSLYSDSQLLVGNKVSIKRTKE